ncbi:MAG: bifunctional protein-serine/threonine kinase/phosphatase [Caldimonas sp.]|uniref:bifunctional protein-serine/threonine kinase/phosphatase n=1 Tax=Caldimonas sp. TaxID=2838790 RepID=UPI00391B62C8
MSFDVDIGHASERGPRENNEDFAAVVQPAPSDETRGLIAAVADGVASGGQGRLAAQTTVMSLVQDFHAVPETWDTTVALDRLIDAHNAWLAGHNRRGSAHGAAMCTLTALVLHGHSYTLAHVGDTRAWLLREGECFQLTQDHSVDHPDLRHALSRAIGLDDHVRVDYSQGELHRGDVFVLTSDGVHGVLRRRDLAALAREGTAQAASEALVRAALAAGSRDNATALVIRVAGLSAGRLEDLLLRGRRLPVPPRLRVGDTLDGYTVTAVLADNGVHRLYQARERSTQALVVIKTLHEARAGDPQERAMLAHEAWLGSRVARDRSRSGLVHVHDLADPSAFYVVYDWHGGQTLEQLMARGRPLGVPEVVEAGRAVLGALGRLHRQGVIHRDVKPANLHRGEDGRWRLLDLGVAVSGREPEATRSLHAGTPSYINPEQWLPDDPLPADAGSDLYALGVTLYQALTGRLPYGEVEPYQLARFRHDPRPPSQWRPDVPVWLDRVVLKAVARERRQRFETAEEFALALERGASRPLPARPPTPLVVRDPAALWKIALAVSLLFNGLLIVWLLFLPR